MYPSPRAVLRTMLPWLVVLALGCDDPRCVDEDFDGYGRHCALGPDCDDANQARNVDCEAVPPPDCEATPSATGCPCFTGALVDCYGGPAETLGEGLCRGGTSLCVNGHYGLCRGESTPVEEVCNDLDDDCDGLVDEGVRSPCGGCNAQCVGETWGQGDHPFVPSASLVVEGDGALVLARTPPTPGALWVANTGEDTLSRIDPLAEVEIARHVSGGEEPTRVAVDYRGDVFVTNRAFEGQSTLTKLASEEARCVDRDLSGTIRTSTSPLDVPPLEEDECILWSLPVGEPLATARALAIDGSIDPLGQDGGDAWVGLFRARELLHIDGRDGTELERIALPIEPYHAAFDGRGVLWLLARDGQLVAIDRRASPPLYQVITVPLACYELNGMAIDDEGTILLTGQACNQLIRYTPSTGEFTALPSLPNPRSALFLESEGWVSHTDGRLSEVRMRPFGVLRTLDLHALSATPIDSGGVARDEADMLWTVSALGGNEGRGLATRVNPSTGQVLAHVELGLAPRVQGDLTGGARRGAYLPMGSTTQVFRGCTNGEPTRFVAVHLHADVGAVGEVHVEYRAGVDASAREAASFALLGTLPDQGSTLPLSIPDGHELELRVTLLTEARDGSPRVSMIGVEYACGGVVID